MIPFIWSQKIHWNRKQISGHQGLGKWKEKLKCVSFKLWAGLNGAIFPC